MVEVIVLRYFLNPEYGLFTPPSNPTNPSPSDAEITPDCLASISEIECHGSDKIQWQKQCTIELV